MSVGGGGWISIILAVTAMLEEPFHRMRILFFSEQFWPESNAPAIHVYERAKLWARVGHEVTVLTSAPNFPEGRLFPGYQNRWRGVEDVEGIRVVRVKTFISANRGRVRRAFDYFSYFASAVLIGSLEKKPDVVVSTSPQLLAALAGVIQSKIHRAPHVFELRDLWPASIVGVNAARPGLGIRLLERLELWLYRRSAKVLAFTGSFKADLVRRGIPDDAIEVIPNGTDLAVFKPRAKDDALARELGLPEGKLVVAYFGTLGLAHGLETVLDAFAGLQGAPVHLLLAGPGAERERIEKRIEILGLTNTTLLPHQPRERMPSLWSLADLALISLRDAEIFKTVVPSKLYEAAAMGLPVLYIGPAGEVTFLLASGGFGVPVPAGDAAKLEERVRELADDRDALARMSACALAAREGFSRERQAERCLGLLAEAADQKTKRPGR